MMSLQYPQIVELVQMIAQAKLDQLDCDGCFEMLAEFAEVQLEGRPLSESLQVVERHLEQCQCCAYEYKVLLESLRAIKEL